MNLQTISDEELAKKRQEVKSLFRDTPYTIEGIKTALGLNLYSLVRNIDPTDTDMMSEEEFRAVRALEDGFAVYLAVNDRVRDFLGVGEKGFGEENTFANLFSMYVGAQTIVGKLEDVVQGLDPSDVRQVNKDYDFDIFTESPQDTLNAMLGLYLSALTAKVDGKNYIRHGGDLANVTKQIFEALSEECVKKKERFAKLAEEVEGLNLEVYGATIAGFSYGQKAVKREYDVTFDEIVGNKELISTLRAIGRNLLFYDPETRTNPAFDVYEFSKTYLLYGQPGTGKTVTLKAFLNWMQERAELYGRPFKHVDITNSIKSKWFGESVQNLKALLSEATGGDAVSVVTIEDIDAIFVAREELRDRPEEKALLNELMNTLEGVMSSNLGNVVFIATTNKPANLDDALGERFRENQVEVTGPESAEDYARLFKIKLKKAIKHRYVDLPEKDKRWLDLGELCLSYKEQYNFSGRAVKNITRDVMTGASRFEQSRKFQGMTDEQIDENLAPLYNSSRQDIEEALKGFAVGVSYDDLREAVERYKGEGLKQEAMRREERKRQLIQQIIDRISLGRMARSLPKQGLDKQSIEQIRTQLEGFTLE